jgi:hypothetical protein
MNPIGYNEHIAKSQRHAVRTPEFTMRDALKVFHAFARDFKNFDPDRIEHPTNPKDLEEGTLSCSDESDSSSEGSDSSLDEMALLYADLEDLESELDERTLLDSATQSNMTDPAIRSEDSVTEGTDLPLDPAIDANVPLKEGMVSSSKVSVISPKTLSQASGEFSRAVDYPLTFIVYRGKRGNITRIETQSNRAPSQYHISLKPNQFVNPEDLHSIIKLIEREQVWASALSHLVNGMAIRRFKHKTPRWFPVVSRHAAHEAVHE